MNPFESWPHPPVDTVMPYTPQLILTIAATLGALSFTLYAINILRKEKDLLPIIALIGGLVCSLGEPISDILGACWYPIHGQWNGINTFRQVPLFVIPGYICQFGASAFILCRWFQYGITTKQLWLYCLFAASSQIILELVGLHFGIWHYYGAQPFTFFNYPLWWAWVDTVSFLVPATLVYLFRQYLQGWSLLLVIPLILSGNLVGQGFTSWPLWSALHSSYGYAATYPAGVLSLILSVLAVHFIGKIVVKDSRIAAAIQGKHGVGAD